ncbi:MAG TPA: Rne/Rng family ribonuclease [Terriglobales bacterium]|nr:Rne/Rng family ribonuclease [Terriglobales bacterium]
MTRELFVSSTPHETKVGMVEDDQLAEVYLERENEYTLAGSIYKGRVTRVLPGMQSAFVDIGLERDAFLYVSDFMELENTDDELEDVPATPVPQERRSKEQAVGESAGAVESEEETSAEEGPSEVAESRPNGESSERREDRGGRGGWRGRRRRRGSRDGRDGRDNGRDRGGNGHDRFNRGAEPQASAEREEYGPPAGYEPIILPGESISKYRGRGRSEESRGAATGVVEPSAANATPLAETFPQDEPLFAQPGHETEDVASFPAAAEQAEFNEERAPVVEPKSHETEVGSEEWDREQKRLHDMNVAAIFGGGAAVEEDETEEHQQHEDSEHSEEHAEDHSHEHPIAAAHGTMEEEEIDEEEADLIAYVEELAEDDAFDDLEEETHSAGDFVEAPEARGIAASAENGEVPFSAEPVGEETAEIGEAEEGVDAVAAEEAELEEAQAEAEALLDAEGRESGTVDARAELRAPAATAAYTQRTQRTGYDRDRGRGGRRFRGGRPKFRRREPQNLPQITDLLKEGQEILVQIAKEPIGKKGARITSHIALPGRFLVYMPTVNHTGVSRKIASEEERQRLKRIIQSERENGHGGFIVRTAAQGADEQELRADIRFLKGLWNEIRTRADNGKSPALIYHDLNVVERVLRDQVTADFAAIWVDNEQEYERILRFANRFQPALVRRVKLYTKETPLFEQFGLKDEIDKALKSKVWLKSGGYIVINQTEALVAIDVNTGKYVGKTARLEDTIVKTNVDAIKEIVRQIRLRDLGGIIVIDFIDMDERRNRQKVMQALEEALKADRAPSKVLQFNDFGLVAITRKRVKQSLERTIGSPCPYCEATGFVKNVNTVCNEIYVEMRKMAKELEHSDVMLRVNPEVAKGLKANSGKWLNELEELTKKTIIVKSDPALHQEQFDIN